jgi:hypothetical protein
VDGKNNRYDYEQKDKSQPVDIILHIALLFCYPQSHKYQALPFEFLQDLYSYYKSQNFLRIIKLPDCHLSSEKHIYESQK